MPPLPSLHISPIKPCGGFSPPQWEVDGFGLRYDRRWMVGDLAGDFMTQREEPRLALVRPALMDHSPVLRAPGLPEIAVPLEPPGGGRVPVPGGGHQT